ncbi:MAG: hypothetical protein LAP40_23115 [Acidobacteriia bacterium]|nr:hypothetical protein [Terriglobia bacterium]
MANRTQETLFDSFRTVTPGQGLFNAADTENSLASAFDLVATQIGQIQTNSGLQSDGSSGVGSSVISAVSKVFTSGLGLAPLIGGLFGLFGGGGQADPPPLVKYTMPEQLSFQGSALGSDIGSADYDQFGVPRAFGGPGDGSSTGRSTSAGTPPQITVNVQAMDSRSFLDHSTEIAQAVRQAMLTLSSVNDVVSDL